MKQRDLAYYEGLWQSVRRDPADQEAYWDGRAEFFNNQMQANGCHSRENRMMNRLLRRGLLRPEYSVLDIGCGVGRNALAFARSASQVVGTDISAQALAFAADNAIQAGVTNLRLVKGDWEQLDLGERQWENRFDLVFAAMCPGIGSRAALEKMTLASRGYCLISLFASREDPLRSQLAAACGLTGNQPDHKGLGVYCAFNLLWLLGYYPEIRLEETCWQHEFSLEEAVRHYGAMLSGPDGLSADRRETLAALLAAQARDGRITETVSARIAWIGWQAAAASRDGVFRP